MNWLVFNRDRQVRYDCCSDGTVLPCRSEGTPRAGSRHADGLNLERERLALNSWVPFPGAICARGRARFLFSAYSPVRCYPAWQLS